MSPNQSVEREIGRFVIEQLKQHHIPEVNEANLEHAKTIVQQLFQVAFSMVDRHQRLKSQNGDQG